MTPFLPNLRNRVRQHLRRLENYTRTDNVYLAKNGLFVFLNHAFSVLNGFVLYILITHFLPKETYGAYKYLLSLFSLFSISTLTGLDNALAKSIANGYEGSLRAAFIEKMKYGVIGSVISIGAASYYFWKGNTDLGTGLLLLAAFAPLIYAANVFGAYFTAKKAFDTYVNISILTGLATFVGMAVAFVFLKDPTALFAAFLLTGALNLFAYLYARSKQSGNARDPGMMLYGKHLSALDILGTVANNIDSILAFHFLGLAPLAVYSLATIPVEQIKGFLKTVPSIAMPKFAVHSFDEIRRHLNRKILLYMAGTSIAVFMYILLAPMFFKLFFPTYLSSVPYSQVYSLSLIFAMPASLLQTLFTAQGLRRETTIFNLVAYGSQIILLVIGAWLFGLWGLIISRLLSRFLMLCSTLFLLKTHRTIQSESAPGL